MSRQLATKSFLNTWEVTERFGWSRDSLYRFHRRGLLQPHKFLGDKKTYWDVSQLESLQGEVFERVTPASNSSVELRIAGEKRSSEAVIKKPLKKKPEENSEGERTVDPDLEIL